MEQQTGSNHIALENLASQFDGDRYEARLVTAPGRVSHLHVRNRHAGVLSEDIYAGHGHFWFSWAERIAPVECASIAAEKIARVLRAEASPP